MNKYRNKKVEYLGIKFQSIKEMNRYKELLLLEKAGEIKNLQLQRKFKFEINGKLVCAYNADFTYTDVKNSLVIVEDTKSPATRKDKSYRIKNKLMRALYGIEILET